MVRCGTLYDVYPYEKMKRERGHESPHSARLADAKKKLPSCEGALQSATSAKLGGKRTSSFRWISRQSGGGAFPGSSKREGDQDEKESSSIAAISPPPKKAKDPSKRIGFVDILMGYHSLLQASPGYPVARQKGELHPTVGFIQTRASQ